GEAAALPTEPQVDEANRPASEHSQYRKASRGGQHQRQRYGKHHHRHDDRRDDNRQARPIRALIISPTRELASQIEESFRVYGRHTGLRTTTVYGGVGQGRQVNALRAGVDILVATPGRLLDLMGQGYIDLSQVNIFVLDEADRLFDMGFIHDIRQVIAKLPTQRQTLLFSATMPREIRQLADAVLRDPISVQIASESSAAETVAQFLYHVSKQNKPALLTQLLNGPTVTRTLVFTRTKHGADKVVRQLQKDGFRAEAIHGDKSQAAREKSLARFKASQAAVLVATDIAARGLDISGVSHVFNFDVPYVAETYVHRIGRTGRAGASGEAILFCDHEEREYLRQIERLLRQNIVVMEDQPELTMIGVKTEAFDARPQRSGGGGRPSYGRSGSGRSGSGGSGNGRPSGRGPAKRSGGSGRSEGYSGGSAGGEGASSSGNRPYGKKSFGKKRFGNGPGAAGGAPRASTGGEGHTGQSRHTATDGRATGAPRPHSNSTGHTGYAGHGSRPAGGRSDGPKSGGQSAGGSRSGNYKPAGQRPAGAGAPKGYTGGRKKTTGGRLRPAK
ncbi:MAG: DEAD/DEAH box helicase, partial [Planctomycetota bacterium]|nr:DEAD/DEAH box helicase [Planctomycetota bacterium]